MQKAEKGNGDEKILVMCEGPNELAVIEMLLERNCLLFSTEDLLDLRPFHARQLKETQIRNAISMYHGKLCIYRIGDVQNEKLHIPAELKARITEVRKICTKPELEMLLIIADGQLKQFEKSRMKPKMFAKEKICCGRVKYRNQTAFYRMYFENDIDKLLNALREYKRVKRHEKEEEYLADYLKQ